MTFVKPISEWTDEEINKKVDANINTVRDKGIKGLTQQEINFDGELKNEYWRREEAGLHKIKCMLCTNLDITYYDIMKNFCSDMTKITDNICQDHIDDFNRKQKEFLNNH